MKSTSRGLVAILAMALAVSACGGGGKSETPAEGSVNGSEVTQPAEIKYTDLAYAAAFDMAQAEKTVQIEGYLQLPSLIYASSESCQLDFYERPNQRKGRYISASIKVGSGNNAMRALPEKYTPADLHIKDADGNPIQANERVRLQGTLSVNPSSSSADGLSVSLRVTAIQAVPEVEIDYAKIEALKITKTNLLDTSLVNVMSFAEGRLTIPSMLFMQDDISLDMAFGDKNLYVNFAFGTGPNQIEDIPENYSKADFKIHDHKGKLINLNKPVKVWGIRSKPGKDNSGFLYVEHIEQ